VETKLTALVNSYVVVTNQQVVIPANGSRRTLRIATGNVGVVVAQIYLDSVADANFIATVNNGTTRNLTLLHRRHGDLVMRRFVVLASFAGGTLPKVSVVQVV
jgi:hypothetical protein